MNETAPAIRQLPGIPRIHKGEFTFLNLTHVAFPIQRLPLVFNIRDKLLPFFLIQEAFLRYIFPNEHVDVNLIEALFSTRAPP